ncbi:GM21562 [Drosophila sechellia]|uniref:GM21562 n=1 Tax=Drosophila sechellia TaxID=7238 RepID=B4HRM4_DROSE|nr:GM21562 [Drosophila sechellia]
MGALKTKIANEFHSFVMPFYGQPMKCSRTVTAINNFQRFSAVYKQQRNGLWAKMNLLFASFELSHFTGCDLAKSSMYIDVNSVGGPNFRFALTSSRGKCNHNID